MSVLLLSTGRGGKTYIHHSVGTGEFEVFSAIEQSRSMNFEVGLFADEI